MDAILQALETIAHELGQANRLKALDLEYHYRLNARFHHREAPTELALRAEVALMELTDDAFLGTERG